jgi:hypothetical protein
MITPIGLLSQQPSIPVVIECPVMTGKEKQKMPPVLFVKNEHLRLRVPLRDGPGSSQRLFVSSIRIPFSIVILVAGITVYEKDDYVIGWRLTATTRCRQKGSRAGATGGTHQQAERQATKRPKSVKKVHLTLGQGGVGTASPDQ